MEAAEADKVAHRAARPAAVAPESGRSHMRQPSDEGDHPGTERDDPRFTIGTGRTPRAMGRALRETREAWPGLTFYERFEQIVALSLTALISVVIAAGLFHLTIRIVVLLVSGLVDPAEQSVFQGLFGMILLC